MEKKESKFKEMKELICDEKPRKAHEFLKKKKHKIEGKI
jgi:hypothetical protein